MLNHQLLFYPRHRFKLARVSARRWILLLLLAGLCGLSSCALIKDDGIKRVEPISVDQIRLADDIHLARDGWPQARWWTEYNDEQLNGLIDQALKDAPSMDIARSQVQQARAKVELVRAGTRLQMTAAASVNRMHVSDAGGLGPFANNEPGTGISGPWYTSGSLGASASYPLDFWGQQRDQVGAAIGVENAKLAELSAVELQISTDVAQLYYGIQTSILTIELLEQAREILVISIDGRSAKLAQGLEQITPIEQARSQLLNIESQIASAQSMIKELREGLRALMGASAADLDTIFQVPLPIKQSTLPPTLSYELLVRRPDLQVMRWYVLASVADINSAEVAFYPSFDIKAFAGFKALDLSDLLRAKSLQLNFIPGVSLPIFDGGRLNANLTGAKAANNLAVAQYNQSVVNAVRDVALASTRLQTLDEQARLQTANVLAVSVSADSADAHFRRGLADKLDALNARLPVIAEEISLVGIRRQQLSQSVALVKALGGGYRAQPTDENDKEIQAIDEKIEEQESLLKDEEQEFIQEAE